MKRLALMRHGEAVPYESDLTDLARPLTRRGAADAAAMAERCRYEYWQPDLIVASPALRTQETALAAARVLRLDAGTIVTEPLLYQAGSSDWLRVVAQLPSHANSALVVAHNPGISEFAQSLLRRESVPALSPATILALVLEIENWQTIADAVVTIRFRAAPR